MAMAWIALARVSCTSMEGERERESNWDWVFSCSLKCLLLFTRCNFIQLASYSNHGSRLDVKSNQSSRSSLFLQPQTVQCHGPYWTSTPISTSSRSHATPHAGGVFSLNHLQHVLFSFLH